MVRLPALAHLTRETSHVEPGINKTRRQVKRAVSERRGVAIILTFPGNVRLARQDQVLL